MGVCLFCQYSISNLYAPIRFFLLPLPKLITGRIWPSSTSVISALLLCLFFNLNTFLKWPSNLNIPISFTRQTRTFIVLHGGTDTAENYDTSPSTPILHKSSIWLRYMDIRWTSGGHAISDPVRSIRFNSRGRRPHFTTYYGTKPSSFIYRGGTLFQC